MQKLIEKIKKDMVQEMEKPKSAFFYYIEEDNKEFYKQYILSQQFQWFTSINKTIIVYTRCDWYEIQQDRGSNAMIFVDRDKFADIPKIVINHDTITVDEFTYKKRQKHITTIDIDCPSSEWQLNCSYYRTFINKTIDGKTVVVFW